jgi:hypothetical protein
VLVLVLVLLFNAALENIVFLKFLVEHNRDFVYLNFVIRGGQENDGDKN